VKSGELDEEVLNEAVRNMLKFISDYMDAKQPSDGHNREADRMLIGELSAQCAVFLKNEDSILPLSEDAQAAFIGEFAKAPRYQGAGSSHINVPHPVGALRAGSLPMLRAMMCIPLKMPKSFWPRLWKR